MELFSTYPAAFLMAVLLPLVTGIVVAVGGYETLKASAKVIEKSKFGFTVVFEPISVPVTQFGFTASAEL